MSSKFVVIGVLCASGAFCQTPIIVYPAPAPRYTDPFLQALQDGVRVAAEARRNDLEQQHIDLDRERLRFEEQQALRRDAPATLSYQEAHPNEASWRINQDIKDSIATCRQAHKDCEKLDGMMQIISKAVHPDWTQLTMTEYVECLYAIAANATFAQHARELVTDRSSK